ncbi:MAG: trypsin-like serine protease [Bdellovibrionaceae bacterium]|nr:trypsin-like serine protease [Pseudobdellovibrionaceae bacterium]
MTKYAFFIASVLSISCTKQYAEVSPNQVGDASRIINGDVATMNDTWTASTVSFLKFPSDGTPAQAFCTGTLISSNLVVTAAHCLVARTINYDDVFLFLGTDAPKDQNNPNLIKLGGRITHSDYQVGSPGKTDTTIRGNDVGLVKLASPAPSFSRPVKILEPNTQIAKGSTLLLAGWGIIDDVAFKRSQNLRSIEVPLADYDSNFFFWITDQAKAGACSGDSGGPAYVSSGDELIVIGATRGPKDGKGDCHHFGEYSDLSKFKDFILESAEKLQARPPVFARPNK